MQVEFGEDLPYTGGLDRGFAYAGRRVPFLNYQKGIYRAAVQRGAAALSINTSFKSPYDDEETELGFLYAYRSGSIDQPDNRALRAAHTLGVPIVYFVGVREGWYRPEYPYFVYEDRPLERRVLVAPADVIPGRSLERAEAISDELQRRYVVRTTRARLHQRRFRGLVLREYRDRCTICRLHEVRLLDAAHILGDATEHGEATVANGLSFCAIHHRAFDQHLIGVSPDYEVRVSRRLLEDDDGPMLDLLKGFHARPVELPPRVAARPDRDRMAVRYEAFLTRG
jgi:putative restriction endonuclease